MNQQQDNGIRSVSCLQNSWMAGKYNTVYYPTISSSNNSGWTEVSPITLQEHQKFRTKMEMSVIFLIFCFPCKSMGTSDFEWCRLYWWPYKFNSSNKNCILVFWSKWHGHISSFQFKYRLQMTKTQICSGNSDQCPISNSDSMLEITEFNWFHNSSIRRVRKLLIENKPQFELV